MLKHAFGKMSESPKHGEKYEEYEPDRYHCIQVSDDTVQPVAEKLANMKCYWHTLDRPENGLAYYGITLLPPESLGKMMDVVREVPEMERLLPMLVEAEREGKFVIHFGI